MFGFVAALPAQNEPYVWFHDAPRVIVRNLTIVLESSAYV